MEEEREEERGLEGLSRGRSTVVVGSPPGGGGFTWSPFRALPTSGFMMCFFLCWVNSVVECRGRGSGVGHDPCTVSLLVA